MLTPTIVTLSIPISYYLFLKDKSVLENFTKTNYPLINFLKNTEICENYVILVASGKGGVGKTSLAVNCAVKLCLDKKRVALLDADFGLANAHIMLDQKVSSSISDLLDGTKKLIS